MYEYIIIKILKYSNLFISGCYNFILILITLLDGIIAMIQKS